MKRQTAKTVQPNAKRKVAKWLGVELVLDGTAEARYDRFYYKGVKLGPWSNQLTLVEAVFQAGEAARVLKMKRALGIQPRHREDENDYTS